MTPRRNAVLKAQVSKLGWMMDDRRICAYQEVVWCTGEVLEQRAWSKALGWCADLKEQVDSCDPTMSPKPHWWQHSFFVTKNDCSSRVHWFVLGEVVEPPMHLYLWDTKGSELYMRPLVQQLRDKGIPLTANPLGFQRFDGWTCGYQSLCLLQQLLQMDFDTDLGRFIVERMPPAFVTHV